jgi:hypothetical protein
MTALDSGIQGDGELTVPAAEIRKPAPADPPAFGSAKRAQGEPSELASIDKSALALPEPRRLRDKAHINLVRKQPCLICGRQPVDAHHLRFAQYPALGRKVSDEFTVPLCRVHHREVHRRGNEAEWWSKSGVDPIAIASVLWAQTHPLRAAIEASSPAAVEGPSPDGLIQPVTNSDEGAAPRQPKRSSNRKTNPILAAGSQ